MIEISINHPEFLSIEFMRVALSEPSDGERQQAIKSIKLDIEACWLDALNNKAGTAWIQDANNATLVKWIAATAPERHTAAVD